MKQIHKLSILIILLVLTLITILSWETKENNNPYYKQLAQYDKYKSLSYLEIQKLPKQDRPDLAAIQHFEMTKDPALGYPPIVRKVQAYEKLIANSSNQKEISNVQWDERGPNNVGGRTRALMFDPNDPTNKKVWSGGISGGLWVNNDITDENIGWTNVDDFMTSLSIATITYDPNNTSHFYLGTGEIYTGDFSGLGIWKSTNSGATWNWISSTSDFSYVPKIVITDNSTIIAATENGIKRSTDGGISWTSPNGTSITISDVELASNGDLFAGDFNGRVHISTDDGATWSPSNPSTGGERVEIGLSESNSSTVYAISATGGDIAWFMKSTDSGATWNSIEIPMYVEQSGCVLSTENDFARGQAWYDLIIGVHPENADIVVIGGIDLYRSTSGGSNWELVSYWTGNCDTEVHADQHAIQFRPGNSDEAIFGNDGGVYYSNDIGNASNPQFIARNKDYNVTQFYGAAMVNEVSSNEFLAGAQDNGTQRFLTPGVNATTEASGGDGGFCHIDQDDPDFQITSYVYSNYYISTNRGVTFPRFSNEQNEIGRFINPTEYDSDANILYGAGDVNQITRITNITTTPSSLEILNLNFSDRQITTIKASPYTNNRLFVGVRINDGEGLLFQVDNADQATPIVTNITNNFDETRGGWVSSIDVGASDNQILATFSNYGVHSIFETTDAGQNWFSKEGNLDDFPVYGGLYNPKNRNEVLIATELGVWSTDDITLATPVWGSTNLGLSNVQTRMLKYRESDGLILAATHGRGLFTTSSFAPDFAASFTTSESTIYPGEPIQINNGSIGTIDNYFWDFGDGFTSTVATPSHQYSAPGTYLITLEINNGLSRYEKEITVLTNRNISYTLSQGGDFESNLTDFISIKSSGTKFELGSSTIIGKDGTVSGNNAWVLGLTDNNYADGTLSYLQSPAFDFSSAGNYLIKFKAKYQLESGGATEAWDSFWLEYSIDNQTTWSKLGDAVEANWYNQITHANSDVNDPNVPVISGTSSGFESFSKDISNLAGNTRVKFRFVFMADNASTDVGLAIDNFEIEGPDSTPIPNFGSTNFEICSGNSVVFNDLSTGTISNYSWDFGNSASPQTATGPGPHEVDYQNTGSYTTTLTVTGSNGDVSVTKNNYVTVSSVFAMNNSISADITEFNSCQNIKGFITVANSTNGIKYQLYNNKLQVTEGPYLIGDGTDLILETNELQQSTEYSIKATSLIGCVAFSPSLLQITSIGPFDKSVTIDNDGTICENEPVNLTVESSDNGIDYNLVDNLTNTIITTLTGNGNDLVFTTDTLTTNVDWSIIAQTAAGDCSLKIDQNIKLIVHQYPEAIIVQEGSLLSIPGSASSYQWFLEGEIVEGAFQRYYDPIIAGTYTCEVTFNGCSILSPDFTTTITGTENDENSLAIIYPNPSYNGFVNITSSPESRVTVYNTSGKVVYQNRIKNVFSTIDLSDQSNGMYIIEVAKDNIITRERINILK